MIVAALITLSIVCVISAIAEYKKTNYYSAIRKHQNLNKQLRPIDLELYEVLGEPSDKLVLFCDDDIIKSFIRPNGKVSSSIHLEHTQQCKKGGYCGAKG